MFPKLQFLHLPNWDEALLEQLGYCRVKTLRWSTTSRLPDLRVATPYFHLQDLRIDLMHTVDVNLISLAFPSLRFLYILCQCPPPLTVCHCLTDVLTNDIHHLHSLTVRFHTSLPQYYGGVHLCKVCRYSHGSTSIPTGIAIPRKLQAVNPGTNR